MQNGFSKGVKARLALHRTWNHHPGGKGRSENLLSYTFECSHAWTYPILFVRSLLFMIFPLIFHFFALFVYFHIFSAWFNPHTHTFHHMLFTWRHMRLPEFSQHTVLKCTLTFFNHVTHVKVRKPPHSTWKARAWQRPRARSHQQIVRWVRARSSWWPSPTCSFPGWRVTSARSVSPLFFVLLIREHPFFMYAGCSVTERAHAEPAHFY